MYWILAMYLVHDYTLDTTVRGPFDAEVVAIGYWVLYWVLAMYLIHGYTLDTTVEGPFDVEEITTEYWVLHTGNTALCLHQIPNTQYLYYPT